MELQVDVTKKVKTGTIHIAFALQDEVLGILGRSGCGKSVTLRCIAGILRPDAGRVVLDGKVLLDTQKGICLPPQKRQIGYLFQNYALFPHMTVRQNILFGAAKGDTKYGEELMERFYLTDVADSYPDRISGGQQQRTAMARMLAAKPKVLLLDEPFSALDNFLRREMEKEVSQVLSTFGGVSVLVSHNKEEIRRLSQKCMIMEKGQAAEWGDTATIFACPATDEGKLLLEGER